MRNIKILVSGSYHSGKTSTIHHLDPNATSIEKMQPNGTTTTVGLDIGKVTMCAKNGTDLILPEQEFEQNKNHYEQQATIVLFGCAGQMRFTDVRKVTMRGAKGVLFVVDSTNISAEHSKALLEEIYTILGENIPLVVLANKQDLPNAVCCKEIEKLLLMDVPVFETSTITGSKIRDALLTLIYSIEKNEPSQDTIERIKQ